jgi:hypothetical protein
MLLKTDQKSLLHMFFMISHFDEVLGPESVVTIPEISVENSGQLEIQNEIIKLIDVTTNLYDKSRFEPFMYSNSNLMSYNLAFSLPGFGIRSANKEFLLSIVLTPPDQRGLLALLGLRDMLPTLRESTVPYIIDYLKNSHNIQNPTQAREEFLTFQHNLIRELRFFYKDCKVFVRANLDIWDEGNIDLV